MKRGFKWISLTQQCVLVSSQSNRRSFGTPKNLVKIFVKKFSFWGGWGSWPIWKSKYLEYFVDPSLNCKLFSLSKLHSYWAIKKWYGSHHCWMSRPALDEGNLHKPSLASTRESENSWPGLWLPCLLRRPTGVAAKTMRLSSQLNLWNSCVTLGHLDNGLYLITPLPWILLHSKGTWICNTRPMDLI